MSNFKEKMLLMYTIYHQKNKLKFAIIILSGKNYSQINTKNILERRKCQLFIKKQSSK